MLKFVISMVRTHSLKALLVASLVAGSSMVSGAAKAASIDLSTGVDVVGNIDQRWTVAYPGQTLSTVEIVQPGFPIPPWLANSSTSGWVVPTDTGQSNAPQNTDFVFSTTFNLANQTERDSAALSGRWLSDNNTLSITLNGNAIAPGVNGPTNTYTAWTSLTGNGSGDFVIGDNHLVFTVHNGGGSNRNPTGFRFEGGVTVGSVPEPASLVLSAASVLMLGGFSWKRRRVGQAV